MMEKKITEHYFSKRPTTKLSTENIRVTLLEKELQFTTASSVFSKGKADAGTIILIEALQVGKNVLDLGCGYGIVGISLKKAYPELQVTCSDVNERAVEITKKNAKRNKVEITVIQSNLFENLPDKYDTIAVNMPQHAGKELCFSLIEEAHTHLEYEGTLQAVARHQKGGKSYEKKMQEVFGNCIAIAKKSGYRVYMSKKRDVKTT